jgi:hypothetical protein
MSMMVETLSKLDLSATDNGASGLNQNAKTILENLVTVVNNGTQTVTGLILTVSSTPSSVDADDTFQFTATDNSQGGSDLDDISNGSDILSSTNLNKEIDTGNADVDFGLVVDLLNGGNGNNALPERDRTRSQSRPKRAKYSSNPIYKRTIR